MRMVKLFLVVYNGKDMTPACLKIASRLLKPSTQCIIQEGILEGRWQHCILFDGLQIAHIIGELCADIWKVCQKSGCPTQ